MRPANVQVIGEELAIKWTDGSETFLPLAALRRACPCAGCRGEPDLLGNLHRGPPPVLTPDSYRLLRLDRVGNYAVQPVWADGHNTGIFPFDYLRRLTPAQPDSPA